MRIQNFTLGATLAALLLAPPAFAENDRGPAPAPKNQPVDTTGPARPGDRPTTTDQDRDTSRPADKDRDTNRPTDTNGPTDKDRNDRTGERNNGGADHDKTTNQSQRLGDAEMQILAHEHLLNQTEIDLARLAMKQSKSGAVKKYAQMILTDHTTADRHIMAFAKKKGVTIGKDMAANDAFDQEKKDAKEMATHMKTLKGADFDREYLDMMVKDHEKELTNLEGDVARIQDSALATLLTDMKPVLQRHADKARDLQKDATQASNE